MKVNSDRFFYLIIGIFFITVSFFLYQKYGVKIVNDSPRYLDYAEAIKQGKFYDPFNFWYLGYVLFIFIVQFFFPSGLAIIVGQIIVYAIALWTIYRAGSLLFNNRFSGGMAALLYLFILDIPAWNYYILTESIYGSFICIALYFLVAYQNHKMRVYPLIIISIFTFFIKPTGLVFLISVLFFPLLMWNKEGKVSKGWLTGGIIFFTLGCILLANQMLSQFILIENYTTGEIIYAMTEAPRHLYSDIMVINGGSEAYLPSRELGPILRLLSFIIHNPVFFMRLFLLKIFWFLAHVRPYYSIWHNIFIILTILPLYFFSIRSLIRLKSVPVKIFLFVYIVFHILIIGLTTVDWDGRFIMPLYPVLVLLAGNDIVHALSVNNINRNFIQRVN